MHSIPILVTVVEILSATGSYTGNNEVLSFAQLGRSTRSEYGWTHPIRSNHSYRLWDEFSSSSQSRFALLFFPSESSNGPGFSLGCSVFRDRDMRCRRYRCSELLHQADRDAEHLSTQNIAEFPRFPEFVDWITHRFIFNFFFRLEDVRKETTAIAADKLEQVDSSPVAECLEGSRKESGEGQVPLVRSLRSWKVVRMGI